MRILIRIVFVIFIAKGIDCLGSNNYCSFLEYENIIKDEDITAESLVNIFWYSAKKNLVLKIFEKKDNGIFTSEGNGDKISINLNGKNNHKIAYQNGHEDKLKLKDKKYALFEIKTQKEETVYLYCSDVESSEYNDIFFGIFVETNHKSISVIACDTEKVTDMSFMFQYCSSLTELDLKNFNTTKVTNMSLMFDNCSSLKELKFRKNFNTSNVTDMSNMFSKCSSLKILDIKNFNTTNVTDMTSMFSECVSLENLDISNFNTTNVTNMSNMFFGCSKLTELNLQNFNTSNVTDMDYMFCMCSSLKELKFGENFNTEKVTKMKKMFYECSSLENLDISNFNTSNVTDMNDMFFGCSSLKNLKYGQNFNTSNVTNKENMFENCDKLPDDIRNKFSNKNE